MRKPLYRYIPLLARGFSHKYVFRELNFIISVSMGVRILFSAFEAVFVFVYVKLLMQ